MKQEEKIKLFQEILCVFPEINVILQNVADIECARKKMRGLMEKIEEDIEDSESKLHPLERIQVKQAVSIFRNLLSKRNEKITGHSFISILYNLINGDNKTYYLITRDFLEEFRHLLLGLCGKTGIYKEDPPDYHILKGRKAAIERCKFLDGISAYSEGFLQSYPSGLNKEVIERRSKNVARILKFFDSTKNDWLDYKWHLKNIITDATTLGAIIELTDEEKKAVSIAQEKNIPFGITPFYLSLMDKKAHRKFDHAIRAQVIPPLSYVETFKHLNKSEMDFMKELDTSPVDLVTRRYPMIAIFKPFNTCAQICVYCQRNWEIDGVHSPNALAGQAEINEAINWFKNNKTVKAVLVTGGDPLIMTDDKLEDILNSLSAVSHIERIRIGTRTPVVLPFRFTKSLIKILKRYHIPGKREICIITHFEHPYEVTPEALEAVQAVKQNTSINFYNQQVFTIENSRKFETAALRKNLKIIGIDPYYVFHAKGKKETEEYIVPISRLLQERSEEARISPGVVRTDEPVYNIPGIGKNHLRTTHDHEFIMLTAKGNRIYEMHPWEKAICTSETYIYEDVPIWSYLQKLAKRGENIDDYKTIWYYY